MIQEKPSFFLALTRTKENVRTVLLITVPIVKAELSNYLP